MTRCARWPSTAAAADRWYRRNRARSRALFDLLDRRRVLQPADRAAPSDRVLRRAPARVQLQHAGQEGARRPSIDAAARNAVRARHRSARDRQAQRRAVGTVAAVGGAAIASWPSATRSMRSPTKRTAGCSTRCAHADLDSRATRCSIGPRRSSAILEHEAMHQETLLYMWHRLPFEQKRAPGRLSRRASSGAAPPARMDRGSRRAARRSASTATRFRSAGTTSSRRCARRRARRSRSIATT